MSDKAPIAKKLTIEIEDIGDERECAAALRKLFSDLRERHGRQRAYMLWHNYYDRAAVEFNDACASFVPNELRLVLEYYAMAKPSKLGLAKELARRNETLRPKESYGPSGSTDEDTMHQQIKRVFRRNEEACRLIGSASPELRWEKLQSTDRFLRKWAEHWARGERGTPVRAQRRRRQRVGQKSK
jgi:hypothetical protein